MTERRLERLKGSGRHGTPAEREAAEREEVVLRRIHEGLEAGTPIRDLGLDAKSLFASVKQTGVSKQTLLHSRLPAEESCYLPDLREHATSTPSATTSSPRDHRRCPSPRA